MFKKILIALLILAFLPATINAQWISLDSKSTSNTPPKVSILSDDNNSTVIKVEISGFDLSRFSSDGKSFHSADLLTDIFTTKPGYPELPHIAKVLAIPDNASISVEVLETSKVQTFKNIHIQPARESWIEGEAETSYDENTNAYKSSAIFPEEYASIEKPSVFRDFRIARLSVFPIRYLASKNEIQAISSITIQEDTPFRYIYSIN